ncbi:dipeptidase [Desertibacillus haloalkaliphilus]|uniref:dipeptidase n=1 Tax=Desertibacillus haloalkaliphilus TaxID=1328930 RepID=UPI001C25B5DE|nr:dipeptidase [Desertibacillus haloalkaliphilus]MBU8907454.1 dipeptidase [Desertibacillus haloalkaliphilus]
MYIIDSHCDALLKLWEQPQKRSFIDSPEIETNLMRIKAGKVKLQCFAIFVEDDVTSDQKFQVALDQIDLFHRHVLAQPEMKQIVNWEDIDTLEDGQIGALLTLEGADAIGNDLAKLRTLFLLGVKSVGLTWNNANLCADGVGERRGAGLTELGFNVVRLNNQWGVWTDVSHLSERSFWDVLDVAAYPIASHSNAKALADHPRNLSDEQAKALFSRHGFIGVVFHPAFLRSDGKGTIDDIIRHIEHFCALGGVRHICFGSDFDGMPKTIDRLKHAGMYQHLINELLKHFKEDDVKGFAYKNFLRHRPVKRERV